MAVQTALVTVEEFLRMPEEGERRLELVNGEIFERPMRRAQHELVKGLIAELLTAYALGNAKWIVCPETEFLPGGDSSLIPDVAVALRSDVRGADPDKPLRFSPVVAVEVVSSEEARRLEDKVQIYLKNGSSSVWIVYPHHQEVFVRKARGAVRIFSGSEVLEDEALPGFHVPVKDLFEDPRG